ncbi:sporulation protein SpoIISA, partial [Bacillus thuringiensis]
LTTQYGIKISQEQYDELNVEKGVLQPETNMVMVATSIVENIVIVVTSQKSIMLDNDISNVYDLVIIHSWLKK